jgi:hypothetical protein
MCEGRSVIHDSRPGEDGSAADAAPGQPAGHPGGHVRLLDLDAALPDPWQHDRQVRAHERREAAEREQALRCADEDDEPAASSGSAGKEAFGQW